MQPKRIKISSDFNTTYSKERLNYVLDFIQKHPLTKGILLFVETEEDLLIEYSLSNKTQEDFFIPAQKCFFKKGKIEISSFYANVYSHAGLELYSVENESKTNRPLLANKIFSFDIFETLFFHISRYEEWYCAEAQKNAWDLMKTEDQFLVKNQVHQIPVVDQLVFTFLKALGLNPEQRPTSYCISHDIDEIQQFSSFWKTLRRAGGLIWKGKPLSSQQKLWSAYWATQLNGQKDPFDNFDWLIREDQDIEKTIYFLVGGDTKYDTPFNLETKRIKEIFETCKNRGYSIGIHPSYATWDRAELFKREKERLEKAIGFPVIQSRQHYLHFDFLNTPKILEQNKIKEDSSLGYNECIGFRCGTGFPYHLYNFKEEKPFNFLENPLVFMDSALFGECNYDTEHIESQWKSFLKRNSHLTKITFNFHNSRFFDAWLNDIPLKEMYEQISHSR